MFLYSPDRVFSSSKDPYSKRNHLVNSLKLLIGASQSELEYKSMSVNEPAEYVDRAWDLGMVWGFSGQE